MNKTIVHIAECHLHPNGGMGRVAWHWKKAFEDRGCRFVHLGLEEVGVVRHPSHFPRAARLFYERLARPADVLLVHEPASGAFVGSRDKLFVVSHGLERRYWEMQLSKSYPDLSPLRLKTRLLYPWWRLAIGDRGLRTARALLLINEEDRVFAQQRYRRRGDAGFVFRNGVDVPSIQAQSPLANSERTILFLGSWIERKGVKTLVRAAAKLHAQNLPLRWLLVGTGKTELEVLQDWPAELRETVEVVATFDPTHEHDFYQRADVFVLPSVFEGQPLALLQAMAAGCCCIATDNSGQKDLIRHRCNGLLFQAGDFTTLASLIETAISDEALRSELGNQAKLAVADRDWATVSGEVVDFVEKIMTS